LPQIADTSIPEDGEVKVILASDQSGCGFDDLYFSLAFRLNQNFIASVERIGEAKMPMQDPITATFLDEQNVGSHYYIYSLHGKTI
jgi:hypothetical protein